MKSVFLCLKVLNLCVFELGGGSGVYIVGFSVMVVLNMVGCVSVNFRVL